MTSPSQARITELEAQMSREDFWNDQNAAQRIVEEANGLKRQVEPLEAAEGKVEDLKVMLELGEAEDEEGQSAGSGRT